MSNFIYKKRVRTCVECPECKSKPNPNNESPVGLIYDCCAGCFKDSILNIGKVHDNCIYTKSNEEKLKFFIEKHAIVMTTLPMIPKLLNLEGDVLYTMLFGPFKAFMYSKNVDDLKDITFEDVAKYRYALDKVMKQLTTEDMNIDNIHQSSVLEAFISIADDIIEDYSLNMED